MINVTIWTGDIKKTEEDIKNISPDSVYGQVASFFNSPNVNIRTATFGKTDCGLTDEMLNASDVLLWWAHTGYGEVPDEIAKKVFDRVQIGMDLIVFHSDYGKDEARQLNRIQNMLKGTVLRSVAANLGEQNKQRQLAEDAAQYLIEHYAEKICLDEVAKRFFISKSHFIKIFRSCYQVSPYHFLKEYRLRLAKELLRSGCTAEKVALNCGFGSVHNFYLSFKKAEETTPRGYVTEIVRSKA